MEGVLAGGRIVFLTLLAFQVFLIIPRFFTTGKKKECILFIGVLIILGVKTYFSHLYVLSVGSSLLLIYVTGNLLYSMAGEKHDSIWNICIGSVSAILAVIILLKLTDNLYFPLFYTVIMIIAFAYPFVVIMKLYRLFKSPVLIYIVVTASLLIVARGWDLVTVFAGYPFYDITLWASIALTVGLGYLAFNEGHIIGVVKNPDTRDFRSTGSVFARLIHTENTLILQDRIIASGILAVGAIHEFKNIITNIKAVCQFGLTTDSEKKKQECLEAALENAEEAGEVVKKYLDTVALENTEKKIIADLKEDLRPLFQILDSHFRRQRIAFEAEIEEGIRLGIGRGEIEQVILNLVRNSVDSLRDVEEGERKICISAKKMENNVVMDFSDTGAGIPESAETSILSSHYSGKGSSGLGLMLVKLIITRNNGQVEYHPMSRGAQFRIILPYYSDSTTETELWTSR